MTAEPSPPQTQQSQRNDAIARNVVFLAIGQVLSTALGLVLTATLGRSLGPSDFGLYYMVLALAGFFSVIVDWGQSNCVLREIARGRDDEAHFLGSAVSIRVAITCASAIVVGIVAGCSGTPSLVVWLAPLAVLGALPAASAAFYGYVFRAKNRTDFDVFASLLGKAVAVAATVVALLVGGGVSAAVLVPTLGGIASLVCCLILARRLDTRLARPTRATLQELVVAGGPIVVMGLALALQSVMDVTLLSHLTSSEVVGWHGAARSVIGLLIAPATILATASFPELCRVAHSPGDMRHVLASSSRLLLTAGAFAGAVLFSFADVAVTTIYGRGHFGPAALILQVCAPFLPLFFMNFLIGNAALAVGKSFEIAVAKVTCVAISGVASWFLISIFQARLGNGAVGLMASFCITELMMTFAFLSVLPKGVFDTSTLGYLLRSYLTIGCVLLVAHAVVPVAPLWVSIPVFGVAFIAAAFATGLLGRGDVMLGLKFGRELRARLSKWTR